MPRSRFLPILALPLVIPSLGVAAERGQTELSFTLGLGVPLSDFEDVAEAGYLFGANVGYYVSPQFALGVSVDYDYFGGSDELETGLTDLYYWMTGELIDFDASWSIFRGDAYAKFLFTPGRLAPYAKVSAGYYDLKLSITALGAEESDSEGNLGLGAGLGLQFQGQGVVGGFVEGLAHNILTDGDDAQFLEFRGGINLLLGGTR